MENFRSRRLWSKNFILILLLISTSSFANSVFINLLPVYVLDLGGSNEITGMMMMGLSLLGILTRIVLAPLFDRFDRKKLLVLGAALYFVNTLAFCFTSDLNVLFVLRVIHGFTQGVFYPAPMTMVGDCVPEDLMVDAMGLYGVAGSLMFAVTPTIGLWLYEQFGPLAMFSAAAVAALVTLLLTLPMDRSYRKSAPAVRRERRRLSLGPVFVVMVLLPCLVFFFVNAGYASVTNFLTACGLARGLRQISLFFLVNHIVVIAVRLLLGRVISRVPRQVCIIGGAILCAGGVAVLAVAQSMVLVLVSAVLIGVGFTVAGQLLQVQVLTSMDETRRGMATTTFLLTEDVGNGVAAAVWGAVSSAAGYGPMYALAGAATLLGCLVYMLSNRVGQRAR